MFPVLWQGSREHMRMLEQLGCPREVPWDFVATHAAQCHRNHDQTPGRLSERGGLGPHEMIAVVQDLTIRQARRHAWWSDPHQAVTQLKLMLEAWQNRPAAQK